MATLTTTITYGEPVGSLVATLGAPGPSGQAATIAVGTTATGAPGTEASVLNVGTSSAAIFDFTIPRGDTGAQGQQGIQGIQGVPGQKGDKGDKGDTGDAATVDAGLTTTGAPGSSASVINSGTSSAAIFDFTIPRGDKGDKGDQGNQGVQGNPGPPGVVYANAPLSYNSGTQTISINLAAYLPKAGGLITGDIQSNNGSGYRTYDGAVNTAVLVPGYLQFNKSGGGGGALTVEWDGITFLSGKQTQPFLGLSGYATESWVTTQLGSYLTTSAAASTYLPLAGGAFNTGANVTLADGTQYDSELAPWGLGVQVSADHSKGTTVEFNGLNTYDGASHMLVTPTGLTFPDLTVQTTAYTGGAGSVAWGAITGTLSSQTDLQGALDAKYDASNPAGFITQGTADGLYYSISNPSGFVDSSYVTGQGYITQGTADGLYYSISNPSNFIAFDINNRLTFGSGTNPDPTPMPGRFWFQSDKFRYSTASSSLGNVIASESWVSGSYAAISGATFTGKVNLATIGAGSPSVNLGGQCDSAPASATNGDIWISNATAPKLTYRMGGVNYNLPVLNQFNTFTNQMVIDTTSSTTAALRVTQRGAGNAIEVEDSTTPDATRFVVDQFGKVGIGTAPDSTAAIKIDANGMSFNGLVFNPTATAAHTGGSDTLDLLVTINGTAYRMGLRPA